MKAKKEEEEEEEGGFCCDPVYYFGWGFLLAVWSWGRSVELAGTEDTGWPQPDTEATWAEREGDGVKRGKGVRRKPSRAIG